MALELLKSSKKLSLKGSWASNDQKNVCRPNNSQNIWDKLYFSCEIEQNG